MSKLHRRGFLAISTVAAASALLVAAPVGVSAAEEPADGSTSGETAAESSGNSSQPDAPAATEWAPQDGEGGASHGGAAPLVHGSSVGSGAVTGKAGSERQEPSYSPASSGSYEPQPPTPSTFDEPTNTHRAESGVHSTHPAATPAGESTPVKAAVGTATPLGHSGSVKGDGAGSAPPVPAASFGGSGDRVSTSSYALPLLAIVVLGLILGFAGVRFRRHRRRAQLEALWREQDAEWEEALRRAELVQASEASGPSAQPLQQIGVG
jgi:hypothetical protein